MPQPQQPSASTQPAVQRKGFGCGWAAALLAGLVVVLVFAGIVAVIYYLYFVVPPAVSTLPAAPTFTNTAPPTPIPTALSAPVYNYTVSPGDTCDSIAAAFGVPVQSLILLNNLDPACANLSAGQTLKIPYGAPSPVVQQPTAYMPTATSIPPTDAPPGPPTFTAGKNALCRNGPSQVYGVATSISQGVSVPIIGKSAPGWEEWWQVSVSGVKCWVWSGLGTASGDLDVVQVVQSLSPPTATFDDTILTAWATTTPVCGPKPPGGVGNCTQAYIAWCNCMGGSYTCGIGGPICILP